MGLKTLKIEIVWQDFEGEYSRSTLNYTYDDTHSGVTPATLATYELGIVAAFSACSNANISSWRGIQGLTFNTRIPPAKISGQSYQNSEDKMYLFASSSVGGNMKFSFPAPKDSDVGADLETWNPSDTNIAALTAALTTPDSTTGAFISNLSGSAVDGIYRGYRVRIKSKSEKPGWAPAIG